MKRLFLFLPILLSLTLSGQAQQVPNGGLETWTTTSTGDHAQNWFNGDDIAAVVIGLPIITNTVTKTTDKYSGNFAAKVETKNVPPFGNMPGFLVLGTKVNPGINGFGGIPFTSRPAAMQMRYKLSGTNLATDSASVAILLTRTINGQQQVVADGGEVLTAAATYTLHTVPLQYHSTLVPDTLRILICSGLGRSVTAGTALYVDDIAMTGTATATRTDAAANSLTLYPNPSADGLFTLESAQEPALLAAALTVSDLLGRPVLTQAAPPLRATNRAVDLRGQPAGVYTLCLATAQGPIVRRLVIQ